MYNCKPCHNVFTFFKEQLTLLGASKWLWLCEIIYLVSESLESQRETTLEAGAASAPLTPFDPLIRCAPPSPESESPSLESSSSAAWSSKVSDKSFSSKSRARFFNFRAWSEGSPPRPSSGDDPTCVRPDRAEYKFLRAPSEQVEMVLCFEFVNDCNIGTAPMSHSARWISKTKKVKMII